MDNANENEQPIERTKFKDKYNINMQELKFAAFEGKIVKGLKEILKAIENNKTKKVYLASDCDNKEYSSILEEFSAIYQFELVRVKNWVELRDIVFSGSVLPSRFIIENAEMKGIKAKIHPKCYAACILNQSAKKTTLMPTVGQ
jgi:ribosomal protein L7Ae-like RNA K-turn-binding protein